MARTGRPKIPNAKREKIDLRVTAEQKETLRAAADSAGMPLTTWVVAAALREASHLRLHPVEFVGAGHHG